MSIASDPREDSTSRGYIGHLPLALAMAPDSEDPPPTDVAQWCLPWRRQQAGRLAAEFEPKAGLNSEKLKRTSNRMAEQRRKGSC